MSESAVGDFGTGANRFQVRLYRQMSHEEWEAVEPVDFILGEGRRVIVVPVPGRWVEWCVEHGSTGAAPEATWCSSASYTLGACVWHRAFIPEVDV